jgi:spore maturation protein CgeB
VYAGAKIVLNITMEQGLSSMNYRVLEVLGSGGFLLTDYKQDTANYFQQDEDLVFYKDNKDLIEKIAKYLKNDGLRAKIAQNGRNKIMKYHTFKQRAEEITKVMKTII